MTVRSPPPPEIAELVNHETRLTTRDAANADQNPDTWTPTSSPATNQNSSAFMTKMKNPRVTIVNGKVRIISTGLTNAFKTPSIAAKTSADPVSSTVTPRKSLEMSNTVTVMMIQRTSIPGIAIPFSKRLE